MPALEPIPGIEGFQIQATALPTHKVIRFLAPVGSVAMMANRKWLLDIGRAMIESAEKMIEPS
ncbi:hypothetical protein [Bradyrhizobium sp.]|uniref:hypothetical protein n=1 Tax=Bradyrhizobium sp. TaxID=376 RepID=UPI0025BBF1A9|nr:hypothetical protein [Bradyrhizobium sp.]